MDKSERLRMSMEACAIARGRTIERLQKLLEKRPVAFPDPVTLIFAESLGKYHRGAEK